MMGPCFFSELWQSKAAKRPAHNDRQWTRSAWMRQYESAGGVFLGLPAFRSLSLYCWSSFFILLWYSCRVPVQHKKKEFLKKKKSMHTWQFLFKLHLCLVTIKIWQQNRLQNSYSAILLQHVWEQRLPSCNCCSCLFRDASLSWYILEQIMQKFISIHSAARVHSKLYSSKDSDLLLQVGNVESCFSHLLLFILIMFS